MAIKRHGKFPQIEGLDKELDYILKNLEITAEGRVVDSLPQPNNTEDNAKFLLKTAGKYYVHQKIDGRFRQMKVDDNGNVYFE